MKPLDRIKVPPFMILGLLFLTFSLLIYTKLESDEMDLEKMQKRNVLLAAKKTQEHIELAENEVSPQEKIISENKKTQREIQAKKSKEVEKIT